MRRPGTDVLIVFAIVTLIGGSNFVAVRFSNRDLAPFWGAGLRFTLAAALLLAFSWWRRIPLPDRAALPGVLLYGIVNFGLVYAFAYWGLVEGSSAVAATLVACAPLMTLGFAAFLGLERFRASGLVGGLISLAGVAVIFADQLHLNVSVATMIALVMNAVFLSLGPVLVKRLPHAHPIATNGVAMIPGAVLLLALALVFGERLALPSRVESAVSLVYLITLGSIGLFGGLVYVIRRWTASASAYVTVLFPIVTAIEGALLVGESVTLQLLGGTALVIVGTYVGAIAPALRSTAVLERAA